MPLPTYPTRLRQLALITPTPSFEHLSHLLPHILDSPIIHRDLALSQWGLENILVPVGGDLLEICTPLPQNWSTASTESGAKTRTSTAVGRLLERRGEGGYMIIMQTLHADRRKHEITSGQRFPSTGGRKVIFEHEFDYSYPLPQWQGYGVRDRGVCIQFHPKGIRGGMLPELDGHEVCSANPNPVGDRFSPWHPLGADYKGYVEGMRRAGELFLEGVVLRLGEGEGDTQAAVEQWSDGFGVPSQEGKLVFSNCNMVFEKGKEGQSEGLDRVVLRIQGRKRWEEIRTRAREAGVWHDRGNGGFFRLVGVDWHIVLSEEEDLKPRM